VAHKAGHALHILALRRMLSEPDAVEVVTWGEERGVAPVPSPALRAARAAGA
jgi:hypothetical protein